ncbi:MAG TPA: VOC family protein [Acidimicrobiales bacterium]
MSRHLFVNLPVADLQASKTFFSELGFEFDPRFTDENATAMVINDQTSVMLLTRPYFETFTDLPVVDAKTQVQTLIAVSAESREEVDQLVEKAVANGATEAREPQDLGFMYQRTIQDLDGHTWEVGYMDMSQVPA